MPRAFWAILIAILIVVAAVFGWALLGESNEVVRISTGSSVGVYNRVAKQLGEAAFANRPNSFKLMQSSGSQENIERLENGESDVAIVQNDAIGGSKIRSLAALYPEVLHLVCRKESNIGSLNDLVGKRINLGAKQSGTSQLTRELLRFAGLRLDVDSVVYSSFEQASAMFDAGQLDAAFFLMGIGSESINRLLSSGEMELVPIQIESPSRPDRLVEARDFVAGFQVHYPHASFYEIPIMAYSGRPQRPIASVGVEAVLVATEQLDSKIAGRLVETLFARRAVLARDLSLLSRLDETNAQLNLQFPLHPGAESYFQRNQPGFLAENAESIGLIVTLILLLGSAAASLHRWYEQSRKNHVDTYYEKIQILLTRIDDTQSTDSLLVIESELHKIERDACAELIDERLNADDSYLILQNMLQFAADQLKRKLVVDANALRQ